MLEMVTRHTSLEVWHSSVAPRPLCTLFLTADAVLRAPSVLEVIIDHCLVYAPSYKLSLV